MIGLKRGTVEVVPYDEMWPFEASKVISLLKDILKEKAQVIEHIGSTSIIGIEAKPIIDIVVALLNLEDIEAYIEDLEKVGIIDRGSDIEGQRLLVMGDFKEDTRSVHIHVVLHDSKALKNYIHFRNRLNQDETLKRRYADLKKELALKYPSDRIRYTEGKAAFIQEILEG